MSTWFDHWDRRYTDRVRLLVEIHPGLAQEPRFALKGGTAINLFEHDLPRLSVDIDLAWLPVNGYVEDARLIRVQSVLQSGLRWIGWQTMPESWDWITDGRAVGVGEIRSMIDVDSTGC